MRPVAWRSSISACGRMLIRQPPQIDAAPTDAENIEALKGSAESLRKLADDAKGADAKGPGATAARRLAEALSKLANADQATREKTQEIFVSSL